MGAREMRGTWQLLQLMQQCDVWPDAITFDILIARLLHSDNIELALQYLGMMSTRGLTPRMQTVEQLIRCACKQGLPRLALDLARSFEEASVRRFDGSIWMDCLISSAESLWVSGFSVLVDDLSELSSAGWSQLCLAEVCPRTQYDARRGVLHTRP